MKAENDRLQSNRKAGVTLVEVAVVVCITAILSGVIYRMFGQQVDQVNNNSKSSQYYMDLGVFTETLKNDLAMSKAVQSNPDGMSLLVNPDGNPGSITYSLQGNKIAREFRGLEKIFRFTNPNQKESPFIFRIEEVNP
ncbi:MAG: hypothetical protein KKB51_19910 [Candidatus Riflebacteria bacterium]|nr:hypothetical protein [Candidatus Riflebacteria bacterium]